MPSDRVFLSQGEADAIEAKIADIEKAADVQIVVAIVGKADAYIELPWKAFALGSALAALALVITDAIRPDWPATHLALSHAVTVLAAGATFALVAIYVPAFGRLFLRTTRRDQEVHQHAQALFLRRELFATRSRNGVLLLTSMFERKVEVLADVGLRQRIAEPDWHKVIQAMTPLLGARRRVDAQLRGLDAMQALFAARGLPAGVGDNELPDRPIQERGSR